MVVGNGPTPIRFKLKLSVLKESIALSMVDDGSSLRISKQRFLLFEGTDDYRLHTTTTRALLLGVVGESCWEIELCLRLGRTMS